MRVAEFVRRWFNTNGFVEVDTAALQASPGNETHLHGFRTLLVRPDLSASEAYLHTSPEFAMKKLLAAGETQIFPCLTYFATVSGPRCMRRNLRCLNGIGSQRRSRG